MAHRLTDTLEPWFAAGFDKADTTKEVTWELVFSIAQQQTPQGIEQTPTVLVYAHIKAATLGEFHPFVGQLPVLGITKEIIAEQTRKVVEKLLNNRTAALYQTNGNGGAPTSMPWTPPKG